MAQKGSDTCDWISLIVAQHNGKDNSPVKEAVDVVANTIVLLRSSRALALIGGNLSYK